MKHPLRRIQVEWVAVAMLGASLPVMSLATGKEKPAAVAALTADAAYAAFEKMMSQRPPAGLDEAGEAGWLESHTARVCDAADRFIRDYPQDPRRWKVAEIYLMNSLNLREVYTKEREKRSKELIAEGLKSPGIDDADWQQMKSHEIRRLRSVAREIAEQGGRPDLADLRRSIDELAAHSPDSWMLGYIEMTYADLLREQNLKLGRAWVEYLAQCSSNKEVAKLAGGRASIDRMRDEPPILKFTALDGREIDLAALRGKVVLIDFWATWCGPCVAEQPNIMAAYEKYRDRGFEVIGISLDRPNDRRKLVDFVAERKLPWPQFFDTENPINRFADRYGIFAIPTQLLLDRDGKLVHDEARGEKLNEELKRLLGG